jgi:hypothetical protein
LCVIRWIIWAHGAALIGSTGFWQMENNGLDLNRSNDRTAPPGYPLQFRSCPRCHSGSDPESKTRLSFRTASIASVIRNPADRGICASVVRENSAAIPCAGTCADFCAVPAHNAHFGSCPQFLVIVSTSDIRPGNNGALPHNPAARIPSSPLPIHVPSVSAPQLPRIFFTQAQNRVIMDTR